MQGDFSRIAYDVLIVSGVNEKMPPSVCGTESSIR